MLLKNRRSSPENYKIRKPLEKKIYYILWVFFAAEFSSSDLADFWEF